MRFCVKKLIIYGLLSVFLSFSFATCFDPPDAAGDPPLYTNVEYSEDGKSVTIYLDGSMPVQANRALSHKLALLGHDFFEVTFLYRPPAPNDTPANYIIARGSWELGETAGVNGVYRTAGGVNYYGTNPVGIPAAGQGTAVLFAGKKSDGTLLAVGVLSHIDGTPVDAGNAATCSITSNTKSVRFGLNAFKANVSRTYAQSSFQIDTLQSSPLGSIYIGKKAFPYFHVPINTTARGTYTIDINSKAAPATAGYSFYQNAIRYAGGAEVYNIEPHYTLPGYGVQSGGDYQWNPGVVIRFSNNPSYSPLPAVGDPFSGAVGFTIEATVANRVTCALTFQIPVYAVYRSNPAATTESVQWNIRPGYGMYYQELDSGEIENGGAILIGIGDIDATQTHGLLLMGDPKKYNNIDGVNFTLENFEIYYKTGSQLENLTNSNTHGTNPGDPNYPSYAYWPGLTFYYDSTPNDGVDQANTPMNTSGVQPLPYGLIKIRVVYEVSPGVEYEISFWVEVNNIGTGINIPYQNRIFIAKDNDFNQISNKISSPGYYLLVLSRSVNLPQQTINGLSNGDVVIFVVATAPNVILGRANLGSPTLTLQGSSNVTMYFGRWPFNEPAFAGGDVITNEYFKISSRNTYENYNSSANMSNTNMFVHGSGRLTINVLSGIEIDYPAYLGP